MIRRRGPVKSNDKRTPMVRLLVDGQCRGGLRPDGSYETAITVSYDQQWRTFWKAQGLGYITEDSRQALTPAGREFLRQHKQDVHEYGAKAAKYCSEGWRPPQEDKMHLTAKHPNQIVEEARMELFVAMQQMTDKDDKIICDHVRKAFAFLQCIDTREK